MPVQFSRSYDLQVGEPGGEGISITELEVSFNIEQTSESTPDTGTFRITNLNEENRSKLVKDQAVVFKVGYLDQGLTTLFVGTIFSFSTAQRGTDIVTTVQAGDGFTPLNQTRVNHTFAARSSCESIVEFLASKMNLPTGSLQNGSLGGGKGLKRLYSRGYVASGNAKDVLEDVTKANGLEYTIQAGYLVVIPIGGTKIEPEVPVNRSTGLIGSPSATSQKLGKKSESKKDASGIKFETLLNPLLTTGRKARVTSKFFTETPVKVTRVSHVGSFRGNDWTTTAESEII